MCVSRGLSLNDFNGGKYNHEGCLKFRWNRMKANENESASFYNKDVLLGNYFIVINVGKKKKGNNNGKKKESRKKTNKEKWKEENEITQNCYK